MILPTWTEAHEKDNKREKLNPLEKFIHDHEPAGIEDTKLFRGQLESVLKFLSFNPWIEYDFYKMESRPKNPGKYFVCRKDGKVHWEQWNGSGWAYNGNVITHWKEIFPPKL